MPGRTDCPYMKDCGACRYSLTDYEASVAAKQAWVNSLLGEFAPVEPLLRMEDPFYYRNKVHRVLAPGRRGKPLCGIYAEGSHRIVPVDRCLIEDRIAGEICCDLARLVESFRLPVYDEDRRTGLIRHFLVRRSASTGEVMAVIVTASPVLPSKKNFVGALLKLHPEITTVVQNVNSRKTNMVLGDRNIVLSGKGFITDRLCGLTFRLSPSSFYQVNARQTEVLYRTALDFAGLSGSETVLDTYCGTGTIGLAAASKAARVIGVELSPDAVRDARANARANGISHAEFIQADATEWMRQTAEAQANGPAASGSPAETNGGETSPADAPKPTPVDFLFLDPPRAGTTLAFIAAAAKLSPSRIVYVSCNPETLARDLTLFGRFGYEAQKIQPVDMFCFAGHVESVVLLSR